MRGARPRKQKGGLVFARVLRSIAVGLPKSKRGFGLILKYTPVWGKARAGGIDFAPSPLAFEQHAAAEAHSGKKKRPIARHISTRPALRRQRLLCFLSGFRLGFLGLWSLSFLPVVAPKGVL
ncbi:hypothetical protein LSM04_006547 [Trypanosoma melophagium]|uniref:uncharacterized protein n=1 Tax=Trypanosoma melophagium TaxID=715481 RepID=UPI003519DF18|nr:hypothetical protein LSM04_006547 [Trypanosoma melophagium]